MDDRLLDERQSSLDGPPTGDGSARMTIALEFDSSSPVARYWLANCVGFTVTGGSRGVVAALDTGVLDPLGPEALVVRRRHRRPRRLPASAVVAAKNHFRNGPPHCFRLRQPYAYPECRSNRLARVIFR